MNHRFDKKKWASNRLKNMSAKIQFTNSIHNYLLFYAYIYVYAIHFSLWNYINRNTVQSYFLTSLLQVYIKRKYTLIRTLSQHSLQ